jgi:hypothetical protein
MIMENWRVWIINIVLITVTSSVLLSLTCVTQIPALTILVGLFAGWYITTKAIGYKLRF